MTLTSNPEIGAARENARTLHENIPLAISKRLPALHINSAASAKRTYTDIGTFNSNRESVGLTISQSVYSSGFNTAVIQQAILNVREGHAGLEAREQQVLMNVAIVFFDILRIERSVRLRERSVEAFKARYEQTFAQFRIGDRTKADVAQAEAEWRVAIAELTTARAELDTNRTVFRNLVGIPVVSVEEPSGIATDLPPSSDAAAAVARKAHPVVRAAEYGVRSAEHAVTAAIGESGLRVNLEGSVSRSIGHGIGIFDSTEAQIGLVLSIPIYQGGSVGARIRLARKRVRQRQIELLVAQRKATQDAVIAWNELSATQQRRTALLSALEAARVALQAIQKQVDIGDRSTREVLDAERKTIDFELAVLSAERNIFVSSFRLRAAVGRLTAKSLGIESVPNLEGEAARTRRKLAPRFFSFGKN